MKEHKEGSHEKISSPDNSRKSLRLSRDVIKPTFEYVVEENVHAHICFGSTLPRDTSPIGKYLAPHMKRYVTENFPKIGPGYYPIHLTTTKFYQPASKIKSVKASQTLSALKIKTRQLEQPSKFRTPSPGRYDLSIKWVSSKPNLSPPFGVGSVRKTITITNTPGPTTYNLRNMKTCRRTKFKNNFGKPEMIQYVETICVAVPSDHCAKCHEICEGDYWHMPKHHIYICQPCWDEEQHFEEVFTRQQLKTFLKKRNCSFMHDHQKTTAAIKILTRPLINKKIRLENYLSQYIKC